MRQRSSPSASPAGTQKGAQKASHLALGVAVVAISFAAIFFKLAEPTPPAISAGTRLAFAAMMMLPFTVRAALRGLLPAMVVKAGLICGVFYGLHFGSWVTSLSLTSVAASVTLVTATPLFLALVGWWTGRDAPSGRTWWAIAIALVGTLIIGWADLSADPDALVGDALALLGALAMVGYLIQVRTLGHHLEAQGRPPLDVLAFAGLTTSVGATCLFLVAALGPGELSVPQTSALGWLLLGALVPQLVGHNLLTWVLRRTAPTVVGLATVGEPVVSAALGWIWLDEPVALLTGLGCGVVLAGIAVGVTKA